jgi:hypothetical protein
MDESTAANDYEWYGIARIKPTRSPYRVEGRPYEECPNCQRYKYRPIYDGRTEASYRLCKYCQFESECDLEPDRYVSDGGKSEADAFVAVFALGMLVFIAYLGYSIIVAIL